MTTLAILKAEIADDLDREALDSQIAGAITRAIRKFRMKRFWWTQTRDLTFPTVVGQSVYGAGDDSDIPDIIQITKLWAFESGHAHECDWISWADWEYATDTSASRARPYAFTYKAEKLYFYPIPDAAYTMRVHGFVQSAAPATDDEPDNRWMTDGYDLTKAEAKRYLALHVTRNYNMAAAMEREAALALRDLTAESDLKTDRGGVICGTDF